MAYERQVEVEQILRLVVAAGREQRRYRDQHLGIGKARHDAVCAAGEFLRHIESPVADQNADISARDAIAGLAYLCELLQAWAVLVLEHDHARMRVDDFNKGLGRDVGLRRLWIVLVDHRNFLAQRRDHVGEIGDDLRFGLEAAERRDHHAASAGVHCNLAEPDEIRGAWIRQADDDGHATVDAAQEITRELSRLLVTELLRFSHHP